MRNRITIYLLMIGLLSSCELSIWGENTTLYQVEMEHITTTSGDTNTVENTVFQVELSDEKFYRLDAEGDRGCFGDLIKNNTTIDFRSNECSCHCECAPFIDCVGDIILGSYYITEEREDVIEGHDEQVFTRNNDGTPRWVIHKRVKLTKL